MAPAACVRYAAHCPLFDAAAEGMYAPGHAGGQGYREEVERWAGVHEGRGGAGQQPQQPSGGRVSAGWAGPECSGGEVVEWGRLELPAFEGGPREEAAGSGGNAEHGVAMGWKAGQVEVVVGLAAVVEGAVEDRAVEAGQRGRGSTGHVRPATWTGLHQAGMGGCDEGDAGASGDVTKRQKRKKLKPGWEVSERGPSLACCQRASPGKRMSLKGGEVEACTPQEEVAVALSGGDVDC